MVFYSFSLVYFSFGKLIFDTKNFKNKSRYLNYAILFILFSLLHIGIQVSKGCVRLSEALLGLLVGLGLGVGWYAWLGKSRWDDEIVYNTTEKSKCKKFVDKFICYGKSNELPYGKKYKTSYKSAEGLNMNKGSVLVFDESNDDPELEALEAVDSSGDWGAISRRFGGSYTSSLTAAASALSLASSVDDDPEATPPRQRPSSPRAEISALKLQAENDRRTIDGLRASLKAAEERLAEALKANGRATANGK